MKKTKLILNWIWLTVISISIGASYFIVFFIFKYCDLTSITGWSYTLWDTLSEVRLEDFYAECAGHPYGAVHNQCIGNYLWLIPISIWNVPMWLMHRGQQVLPPKCFMWTKIGLIICVIFTVFILITLINGLNVNLKKWDKVEISVLFLSSPEIILSVVYAGQDEIVYILLFMLAMYRLLIRADKRGFLVYSIISVNLCPIMFLPYMAVILMFEKRIVLDLGYGILAIVPTAIFELVYKDNQIYHSNKEGFTKWVSELLSVQTIPLFGISVSVLGCILIGMLCWCYFAVEYDYKKNDNREEVIWILLTIMLLFCVFSGNHFYRFFLYLPFLIVYIYQKNDRRETSLFFYMILQICRTVQILFVDDEQVLNPFWSEHDNRIAQKLIENLTRQGFYSRPNFNLGKAVIARLEGVDKVGTLIGSVLIVCTVYLLFGTKYGKTTKAEIKLASKASVGVCASLMFIVIISYFMLIGWWI